MKLPRLYAIADASFGDPVEFARQLFAGGARLVQIRNKSGSAGELARQVQAVLGIAPPDASVIVNDRVDIALLWRTHGVHLGQDDLPVEYARSILGSAALIGLSTHNLAQALEADRTDVNYIAVGPVYQTSTKANPAPVLGVDGLRQI